MTDRVREGVFSSLGSVVVGADVADLYAGTGAVGLEALSRGAASVVFVERSRRALGVLRANIAVVGLGGAVAAGNVERFLAEGGDNFSLAFVDPPYAASLASVQTVLGLLERRLAPGATLVLHRRAGTGLEQVEGLQITDRRRYGDSEITRLVKEIP